MKATGIVRKIDDLGRLVLPIELRRAMGIDIKDSLEIFTEGDTVVLRKYAPGCAACGSVEDVKEISGLRMCKACRHNMLELLTKMNEKAAL